MPAFDPADFADWIGRASVREEALTPRLIDQARATLEGLLAPVEVPLGLHWALCADALGPGQLGRDGHPATGLHLPKLPLDRRMWAGGTLAHHIPLHPGDLVVRESRIEDIRCKMGRTGPLGFVTLRHLYAVGGALCVDETQTLVYRDDPSGLGFDARVPVAPRVAEPWAAVDRLVCTPDPVLLFRFSALTFNGHRIHYDQPYATQVEGYGGLVVHGPLQALVMLNLAARVLGQAPAQFSYRGVSPLVVGQTMVTEARDGSEGLDLRVRVESGPTTMTGRAVPQGPP